MSRFNARNLTVPNTVNPAGGVAYQKSPELELLGLLATNFLEDKFYRSAAAGVQRLAEVVALLPDKSFAAKSAIYARDRFHVRSVTHALAVLLGPEAHQHKWARSFYGKVVERPDDVLEILALWQADGKRVRKLPNAMKKGLADALRKFDAHRLAKYARTGSKIKMVDAINLLHPKPTAAITALIKGEQAPPETWEVKLTQAGQEAENEEEKAVLKDKAWKDLVESRKIGYFALLRNLRNIAAQAPEVLDAALELLRDPRLIAKSKVLPFRYQTAYEQDFGPRTGEIKAALSEAAEIALGNAPKFPGRTLVALDISGSMSGVLRKGALFAVMLAKQGADLILFDTKADWYRFNPKDSLLTVAGAIQTRGGTDFGCVFPKLEQPYDRIIVLTDEQSWVKNAPRAPFVPPAPQPQSTVGQVLAQLIGMVSKPEVAAPTGAPTTEAERQLFDYRKRTGANPFVHSWDLSGYGSLQFPENRISCLTGWSTNAFTLLALAEQDPQTLINAVKAVEL